MSQQSRSSLIARNPGSGGPKVSTHSCYRQSELTSEVRTFGWAKDTCTRIIAVERVEDRDIKQQTTSTDWKLQTHFFFSSKMYLLT